MRVIAITVLFTLTAFVSIAQKRVSDKIYWIALERYTARLDSLSSKYSEQYATKNIYLQKPDYIDSIPSMINGYKVTLITPSNQTTLYKEHQSKLIHTVIFPVNVQDSILKVTITPYRGELKKNHYNLGVSDGTTIYFKFDCIRQRFITYKVESWGI